VLDQSLREPSTAALRRLARDHRESRPKMNPGGPPTNPLTVGSNSKFDHAFRPVLPRDRPHAQAPAAFAANSFGKLSTACRCISTRELARALLSAGLAAT